MMAAVTLTIAVAQPRCVPGDLRANAEAHADAVERAAARVVVFPELSVTGYDLDAPPVDPAGPDLAPVAAACAARGSVALVGAPVGTGADRQIATLAVSAAGAAVAYAKTSLGDDETGRFRPGDGPAVVEVDGWRIGLGICKDTRIRAHLEATLALGIDLYAAGLVHHPDELADQDGRAARIVELGAVPVAFASAAGPVGPGHPATAGHSCVWTATGTVAARAGAEPGAIARAVLTRG